MNIRLWPYRAIILLIAITPLKAIAQMPLAELSINMFRIEAEVAASDENRQRGLMFRREMPPHHGMIFVFSEKRIHCMWMRNTFLPLSVAFLDDEGIILNIEEMQPQTEINHCAAAPARYALEMNRGWFAEKGIGPGTKIEGIKKLTATTD